MEPEFKRPTQVRSISHQQFKLMEQVKTALGSRTSVTTPLLEDGYDIQPMPAGDVTADREVNGE